MIAGIDHIAIEAADAGNVTADYASLLGRPLSHGESDSSPSRLQLDNLALRFVPPTTPTTTGPDVARLRLTLSTPDLAAAARRLSRRGLPGTLRADGLMLDLDPAATHDVAISVVQAGTPAAPDTTADISGLDHVVVRTPDPERAVALYGGRLGLDLRLDRTNPQFGNRLLFFVCGGLVVEIAHDTKAGVGAGPDRIRGLAWRARDATRAHARIVAAGFDVSELRSGRKPGTHVFTVRNRTAGIPTLVIGGEGLERT